MYFWRSAQNSESRSTGYSLARYIKNDPTAVSRTRVENIPGEQKANMVFCEVALVGSGTSHERRWQTPESWNDRRCIRQPAL